MRAVGTSRNPVPGRAVLSLAAGIATASCAGPAPQSRPAAVPRAAVSYDGRYEGTIRVAGGSVSMNPQECAAPPRFAVEVRNNRFSLAQPHSDVAAGTSSLRDSSTPVYNATVRPDGTISGISNETNVPIEGRISGAHMVGQINGLLCYYDFTADRV